MNSVASNSVAAIEAWPQASVLHFDASDRPISDAQAAAVVWVHSQTASSVAKRRVTVAGRALVGFYDLFDPDQDSLALRSQRDALDAHVDRRVVAAVLPRPRLSGAFCVSRHRKIDSMGVCPLVDDQTAPLIVPLSEPRATDVRRSMKESSHVDWTAKTLMVHLIEPSAFPPLAEAKIVPVSIAPYGRAVSLRSPASAAHAATAGTLSMPMLAQPLCAEVSSDVTSLDNADCEPIALRREASTVGELAEGVAPPVVVPEATDFQARVFGSIAIEAQSGFAMASAADTSFASGNVRDLICSFEKRSSASFNACLVPPPSTPRRQGWNWRYLSHSRYVNAAAGPSS